MVVKYKNEEVNVFFEEVDGEDKFTFIIPNEYLRFKNVSSLCFKGQRNKEDWAHLYDFLERELNLVGLWASEGRFMYDLEADNMDYNLDEDKKKWQALQERYENIEELRQQRNSASKKIDSYEFGDNYSSSTLKSILKASYKLAVHMEDIEEQVAITKKLNFIDSIEKEHRSLEKEIRLLEMRLNKLNI